MVSSRAIGSSKRLSQPSNRDGTSQEGASSSADCGRRPITATDRGARGGTWNLRKGSVFGHAQGHSPVDGRGRRLCNVIRVGRFAHGSVGGRGICLADRNNCSGGK